MKVILVVGLLMSMLFGQVLYEEYFTGGAMQLDWHSWFTDTAGIGDSMQVISDPTTPGGDDWAGKISNEYMTISGLTYAGIASLADYAVEAWIYTTVAQGPMPGPYNGIAIRMDSTTRKFYRLVSDFDNSARLRLGIYDPDTNPPTIPLRDWESNEIPGGVPSQSSWHKFKMKTIADSIWCYYDDSLLPDCPIIDNSVSQGFFGVYVFNMTAIDSTKCDNIIALDVTGVAEQRDEQVRNFEAYPNPFIDRLDIRFEPSNMNQIRVCRIFDISGRMVKELTTTVGYQSSVMSWDGRDERGVAVAPGVYFIVSRNENTLVKVVKLR